MKIRTGDRHPFTPEETGNDIFTVKLLPTVDYAAKALREAQDRYFSQYPAARKAATDYLWDIIKASATDDHGKTLATAPHIPERIEVIWSDIIEHRKVMVDGQDISGWITDEITVTPATEDSSGTVTVKIVAPHVEYTIVP